jgi:hypothetical protein
MYFYMAKSKLRSPSTNSLIFGGILVGFAAIAAVGLLCITLFGLGYYLIVKYNKPGTKLFKEIQPMQYLGIFFCLLGVLPFIQYFFMGFLFSAGESVFSNMFE